MSRGIAWKIEQEMARPLLTNLLSLLGSDDLPMPILVDHIEIGWQGRYRAGVQLPMAVAVLRSVPLSCNGAQVRSVVKLVLVGTFVAALQVIKEFFAACL